MSHTYRVVKDELNLNIWMTSEANEFLSQKWVEDKNPRKLTLNFFLYNKNYLNSKELMFFFSLRDTPVKGWVKFRNICGQLWGFFLFLFLRISLFLFHLLKDWKEKEKDYIKENFCAIIWQTRLLNVRKELDKNTIHNIILKCLIERVRWQHSLPIKILMWKKVVTSIDIYNAVLHNVFVCTVIILISIWGTLVLS